MSDNHPPQPPPDPASQPPQPPGPSVQPVIARPFGMGGPGFLPPFALPAVFPQVLPQPQIQLWQGQFPPPDAVQKYEEVTPGAFDRIIKMAERLQAAQIEGTERAQNYAAADSKRGAWLGFTASVISTLGAIGCTVAAALTGTSGPYWVATALVSVPVMAVARALVESAKTPTAKDIVNTAGRQPSIPAASPQPPSPPDATAPA